MTANQIAYQNMLETRRSNVARETENYRSNVAKEKETNRHNLITEGISRDTLSESIRHNKTTENETYRHNKRTEDETAQHNRQTEALGWSTLAETKRHNEEQEYIGRQQADASQSQADAAWARVGNESTKIRLEDERGRQQLAISSAAQKADQAYKETMADIGWTNAIWGNINGSISAAGKLIGGIKGFNIGGSSGSGSGWTYDPSPLY